MKMKKLIIIWLLLAAATSVCAHQKDFTSRPERLQELSRLTGPWLGQKPPGLTPEIFAPDILTSKKHPHGSMAFSKDERSIYWSAMLKDGTEQTIFFSEYDGTALSMPLIADFAADSGNGGPSFSSDGKRIYFNAQLPGITLEGNKPTAICYSEWNNSGWSSPVVIEVTKDTIMTKGQVSVAKNGNIYFSGRKYNEQTPSIYVCRNEEDRISALEKIKGKILEAGLIADPWIEPDEKYLFFIRSASQQFVGDKAHFYWVSAKIIEDMHPKE